ncbi:LacI family DNA-binding transcriptional regulator [Oricola thermophila]|uniref:LacI family DNA-binding transcriptional regulator n=1 Tax=Oricola thermophila TaxID=2742145 RepID=A0A6N1VA80_9HYPH|nr:LacI family DNA-binding transcriptional regulator [Oricola thermophila]QKV17911.1 LacI family DNA-binding transcriptional regulator [Oricola thermophila]
MTRVTIKSIARDLGISHMTVSRALSNHPNVQKETREAVLKRAEELGYVRSSAAAAMRGEDTRIVGLLLPNITNEFYARYANALALECDRRALHLIIHLTNDDIRLEAEALRRLREVQARSVVMVPAPGEVDPALPADMRAIQLIRRRTEGPAILVDDSDALTAAVLQLARAGHARIGYVGAVPSLSSGHNRRAAYRAGLARAGLPFDTTLEVTGAPTHELGRTGATRLCEAGADALVCGGFEIASGALATWLEHTEGGKRVSFVGYGDTASYPWIRDGIASISVPVEALAGRTAALLAGELAPDGPDHGFKAEFVVRGSAN